MPTTIGTAGCQCARLVKLRTTRLAWCIGSRCGACLPGAVADRRTQRQPTHRTALLARARTRRALFWVWVLVSLLRSWCRSRSRSHGRAVLKLPCTKFRCRDRAQRGAASALGASRLERHAPSARGAGALQDGASVVLCPNGCGASNEPLIAPHAGCEPRQGFAFGNPRFQCLPLRRRARRWPWRTW